jgi:hypothetical protein
MYPKYVYLSELIDRREYMIHDVCLTTSSFSFL